MEKYVCVVCGYIYDEELGDPENGIAPGTKWEDVPEDYMCPLCGVGKDQFEKALKTLKVESFGEVGEKFDPSIHNAISHIEEESDKESEISKVFQKGYKSSTRVIRHAMVQVTN